MKLARCGGRGDSGASSAGSGCSAAIEGASPAFGLRSHSSGPRVSPPVAANRGSGARGGATGSGGFGATARGGTGGGTGTGAGAGGAGGIRATGGANDSTGVSAAAVATGVTAAGAAAWRATGRTASNSAIRFSCRIQAASPRVTRPPTTATLPATISVFPRLKALIGMPNPMVRNPAAMTRSPSPNSTTDITQALYSTRTAAETSTSGCGPGRGNPQRSSPYTGTESTID